MQVQDEVSLTSAEQSDCNLANPVFVPVLESRIEDGFPDPMQDELQEALTEVERAAAFERCQEARDRVQMERLARLSATPISLDSFLETQRPFRFANRIVSIGSGSAALGEIHATLTTLTDPEAAATGTREREELLKQATESFVIAESSNKAEVLRRALAIPSWVVDSASNVWPYVLIYLLSIKLARPVSDKTGQRSG